jgi:hypothetical protein
MAHIYVAKRGSEYTGLTNLGSVELKNGPQPKPSIEGYHPFAHNFLQTWKPLAEKKWRVIHVAM